MRHSWLIFSINQNDEKSHFLSNRPKRSASLCSRPKVRKHFEWNSIFFSAHIETTFAEHWSTQTKSSNKQGPAATYTFWNSITINNNMRMQDEALTFTHSVYVSCRLSWFECNLKRADWISKKMKKQIFFKKWFKKFACGVLTQQCRSLLFARKSWVIDNNEQWMNHVMKKKMKNDTKYKTRYWSISLLQQRICNETLKLYYDAGSVLRNMPIYISFSEHIQMIDCCNWMQIYRQREREKKSEDNWYVKKTEIDF